MGTHTKPSAPKTSSSSSTGGFGWKFGLLVAAAAVIAWLVTR